MRLDFYPHAELNAVIGETGKGGLKEELALATYELGLTYRLCVVSHSVSCSYRSASR